MQSGPYKYLRHPSYTGAAINGLGSFVLLYHHGLWPVFVTYAAKWTNQLAYSRTPVLSSLAALSPLAVSNYTRVNPTFLGIDTALWIAIVWSALMASMLMKRVKEEEKMLKQHFGRDWVEYASKRWRFIPLLY